MSEETSKAPIIIKKVQAAAEAGHHGGAWKVAYADFVTAMMAFFLLMWLLNATTQKQRTGLADYFNPTMITSLSGGTSGMADGGEESETTATNETNNKEGAAAADAAAAPNPEDPFPAMARQIQDQLSGTGAESMQEQNLLRHIATRMTDEGLVIELGDLAGEPLFIEDTAQPHPRLATLAQIVNSVLAGVNNKVALGGHVRAYPEMLAESPSWPLSDARAHTTRHLLEHAGMKPRRISRVTGHADRQNKSGDPMAPNNNRIDLILLK